jgi:hypothetical protein
MQATRSRHGVLYVLRVLRGYHFILAATESLGSGRLYSGAVLQDYGKKLLNHFCR